MAFTFAGRWGPQTIEAAATGLPLINTSCTVFLRGTQSKAAIFTDRTKGTAAGNPTFTDALGNLTFFADPGEYDVLVGLTTLQVSVLPDAADGARLSDSETFSGTVTFSVPPVGVGGMTNPMTTLGDVITGGTAGAPQRLGVGTNGQVLTVVTGAPAWASSFVNPMTTAGDLIDGGAGGAAQRLAVGSNGQFLQVVTGAPAWGALPTLDLIPAPAAAVAFNAKKITGLANGTAATDGAAFGQIPAALPPNGAAGGDLTGTYPNPTLAVNRLPLIENVNVVAASGAAVTIPDVTTATINNVTLTANCTFTFPTAVAGKSFLIRLLQDGTGSRLATWPATVKWSGSVKTLSTAANAQDLASFVCVDGTNWMANLATAFA